MQSLQVGLWGPEQGVERWRTELEGPREDTLHIIYPSILHVSPGTVPCQV